MKVLQTNSKLIIAFVAWWVLWIILHAAILYQANIATDIAWIDSLVSNFTLALACWVIVNVLRFYIPKKNSLLLFLFWGIVLSALCTWSLSGILGLIFSSNQDYLALITQSLLIRFCFSVLTIGWAILFGWIWRNTEDKQHSDKRKADAEQLLKDAELANLRQQLQPHFLFNSLNSISALAGSRPEEARNMIRQLADFLRGTLKKEEQQLTSLEEEIKHLQLYLGIEKVRFGHRLKTNIYCDEEAGKCRLPSLLIQPIVENAIKFGLYNTTGEVTISIECKQEDKSLKLSVENPFDPETSPPQKGTGFGLRSVQRRLYLLYARNDLLQTKQDQHIFTTLVHIPQANE